MSIEGVSYVSRFEAKKTNLYVEGQLLLHGKKTKIEDAFIKYGHDPVGSPPPGLEYLLGAGQILEHTIYEDYGFDEDQLRDDLLGDN